ncbi:MAG: hypothetical protein ABFD94_02835 [Armatimonadia bacterium]
MTHLRLDIYDPLNQTYQGTLTQPLSSELVDEFNQAGYGTVTVPLFSADAALLVKDAVVRVVYRDEVRFAWFVETRDRDLANSSGQQTLTASGRGLLAWLEDAVLYPQGGLADFLAPDRPFNWASGPGTWRTSGNYQAALGVQWKNDTTSRKNLPVRWKDPSAQWIWRTNPETVVQRGTVNWFYRDFTLTDAKRVKFYASCDNQMDVYLDGQQIMSSSDFDNEAASFTQMARFTIRLGIGTHTLAARVKNDKPWQRYDLEVGTDDKVSCSGHGLANGTQVTITDKSGAAGLTKGDHYFVRAKTDDDFKLATSNSDGTIVNVTSKGKIDLRLKVDNTAGFILTGIEVDSDGKETDTVVVRTNTNWQVSSTEPYWRPAMILRTLAEEAAARGVYRMNRLTYGFTTSTPTSGSWTTEADLTLKVGATLLTVLDDMVDLGHDFWLNPTTLELEAWESRGADLSGTVLLDTGQNLSRFSTSVERPLKTVALVRTKNGWLRTADNTLRDTNGWRETFLEYGNTASEDVAKRNANRVLARTGKTQVIAQGIEVVVTTGAVPYVDFTVGDVVSIPDPSGDGVPGKARVLSIGLKEEGGGVSFQPELEVITSA